MKHTETTHKCTIKITTTQQMMKEFTPSGLRLFGPASNGLTLFHYAQNGDYIHLQCSNGFKTYSISFRIPKNSCITSF